MSEDATFVILLFILVYFLFQKREGANTSRSGWSSQKSCKMMKILKFSKYQKRNKKARSSTGKSFLQHACERGPINNLPRSFNQFDEGYNFRVLSQRLLTVTFRNTGRLSTDTLFEWRWGSATGEKSERDYNIDLVIERERVQDGEAEVQQYRRHKFINIDLTSFFFLSESILSFHFFSTHRMVSGQVLLIERLFSVFSVKIFEEQLPDTYKYRIICSKWIDIALFFVNIHVHLRVAYWVIEIIVSCWFSYSITYTTILVVLTLQIIYGKKVLQQYGSIRPWSVVILLWLYYHSSLTLSDKQWLFQFLLAPYN